MNEREIKKFIKEHLVVEVEINSGYEPGDSDSIKVSLRFNDDKRPFIYSTCTL